jgi:hypothetical protein
VIFTGGDAAPVVTVKGAGLGTLPTASPSYAPGGHVGCAPPGGNEGLDFGTAFYLDEPGLPFSAGRYRPQINELDCVGLVATSFSPTEVHFSLGSAYAKFRPAYHYTVPEGQPFTLVVNDATFTGTVHYQPA